MRYDGTIAVVSGEAHVWPQFALSLAGLAQRHPKTKIAHYIGTNIATSRNHAFRDMVGGWIWFIDTDMTFPPDTLERLLLRQVDVVQGLCLLRHPPHYPVVYGPGTDGGFQQAILAQTKPIMHQVAGVGTGGTLFRRRVVEATGPNPWFEVGQINPEELGEDLWLSRKIAKAGFKMWCDYSTPLGHMTAMAVWPMAMPDGRWTTAYKTSGAAPPRIMPAAGDDTVITFPPTAATPATRT